MAVNGGRDPHPHGAHGQRWEGAGRCSSPGRGRAKEQQQHRSSSNVASTAGAERPATPLSLPSPLPSASSSTSAWVTARTAAAAAAAAARAAAIQQDPSRSVRSSLAAARSASPSLERAGTGTAAPTTPLPAAHDPSKVHSAIRRAVLQSAGWKVDANGTGFVRERKPGEAGGLTHVSNAQASSQLPQLLSIVGKTLADRGLLAAKAREEHSRSVLNAALERRRAREVLVNAIHQVQLRQQLEASHAAWEAATQQKPEGFDEFATREP